MIIKKQVPFFPAIYIQASSFRIDKDNENKASSIFIDGVKSDLVDGELVYLLSDTNVIIDTVMGKKNENNAL
ncbi:hypothetical protein [Proteus mirabilis]|uniref:hypothetical protein n=1 Tax=Proteus mirabilis TaxID=584 RepID=UPI0025785091|nr:hypothetical protein [Proteus mirabilis]MDM3576150.1 hypothetical protein [Proteus mirabilis]